MPGGAKVAAMITIHGIGDTTGVEVEELKEAVSARLAGRKGARLYFGSVGRTTMSSRISAGRRATCGRPQGLARRVCPGRRMW